MLEEFDFLCESNNHNKQCAHSKMAGVSRTWREMGSIVLPFLVAPLCFACSRLLLKSNLSIS